MTDLPSPGRIRTRRQSSSSAAGIPGAAADTIDQPHSRRVPLAPPRRDDACPMIPTLTRSSTSSAARRPITARAFPITHDADEKAIRLHTLAFPMDKRVEHDSPPVPASRYDHPEADQGRGLRRRRRLADGGQYPCAPLLVACRLACEARLDGGEGQLDAMGAGNQHSGEVQLILGWRGHPLHHDLCPALRLSLIHI